MSKQTKTNNFCELVFFVEFNEQKERCLVWHLEGKRICERLRVNYNFSFLEVRHETTLRNSLKDQVSTRMS